jgi:hypothetical protein
MGLWNALCPSISVGAASLCVLSLGFAACSPALAWEWGYDQICYYNGEPRKCDVNHGYRIPLAKGSDVDIHWGDGEVTTVRYLSNGPLRRGSGVIINGNTRGTIESIFNNTRGGAEIDNYATVRSQTGKTFSYQYIMD